MCTSGFPFCFVPYSASARRKIMFYLQASKWSSSSAAFLHLFSEILMTHGVWGKAIALTQSVKRGNADSRRDPPWNVILCLHVNNNSWNIHKCIFNDLRRHEGQVTLWFVFLSDTETEGCLHETHLNEETLPEKKINADKVLNKVIVVHFIHIHLSFNTAWFKTPFFVYFLMTNALK